jgi:Ca-activated chloride channel family protein
MTRRLVSVLSLLFGMACAAAGQANSGEPPATIRLDVNLVVIHVTVHGKDGKNISGLQKEAFKLFVDDLERPIGFFQGEDAPVTVGVLLDNSASMARKGSEAIAAALAFARSSNPRDQMFVIHFNDRVKFGLAPEKPFTDSTQELEAALSKFAVGGTTALYDAMGIGLSHMDRATIQRKVLITISDGGDNSSQANLTDMLHWAQDSGVVFYCIGLFDESDNDRNPDVLEQFAQLTGGKAYFPSDVADVTQICIAIAREIRTQYTVGFAGAEDGKYHRIRVKATDPKGGTVDAFTRPGYLAARP